MSEIVKNFVSSGMKTTLTCPKCQKSKHVDVSRFLLEKKEVKLKCRCLCGYQFLTVLERRRSFRKDVSFPGWIIQRGEKLQVQIEDLSKHGMKVHLSEKTPLLTGEKIGIQFNMDDPMGSNVARDVRVMKMISPTDIGCEFLTFDHSGSLGKYFLFYF